MRITHKSHRAGLALGLLESELMHHRVSLSDQPTLVQRQKPKQGLQPGQFRWCQAMPSVMETQAKRRGVDSGPSTFEQELERIHRETQHGTPCVGRLG